MRRDDRVPGLHVHLPHSAGQVSQRRDAEMKMNRAKNRPTPSNVPRCVADLQVMAFFSFISLSLKKRLDGADCFRHQTSCRRSVKAAAFWMHLQGVKKEGKHCVPSKHPCFHHSTHNWCSLGCKGIISPSPHPSYFSLPFAFLSISPLFSLSLTCEWQPIRGRVASASASVTSTARSDALLEKEGGGGGGQGERSGGGREGRQERQRRDDRKKV